MERSPKWFRGALVYLTVSFAIVGFWATLHPKGFYDGFPGAGRRWITGDGPYNAHLATDAGVGFLAVGAVLLLATVWMDRRVVEVALIAVIVHGTPHLIFHLVHPNDALETVDSLASNGSLALGTVLAVVLLLSVNRSVPSEPQRTTTANERTN